MTTEEAIELLKELRERDCIQLSCDRCRIKGLKDIYCRDSAALDIAIKALETKKRGDDNDN